MHTKNLFLLKLIYLKPSLSFLEIQFLAFNRIKKNNNKVLISQNFGGYFIFYGFAAILINFLKSGQI